MSHDLRTNAILFVQVRKINTNRNVDVIYKEVCSYVEAI